MWTVTALDRFARSSKVNNDFVETQWDDLNTFQQRWYLKINPQAQIIN